MNLDLDDLIAELECGDEERCWDAASEIIDIGPTARDAVPSLTWVLRGSNYSKISPYVAGMAADALGAIGPAASEAVESLELLANDQRNAAEEGRWLRLRSAAALWNITGDETIARRVANELSNDPDEWLSGHAVELLDSLPIH